MPKRIVKKDRSEYSKLHHLGDKKGRIFSNKTPLLHELSNQIGYAPNIKIRGKTFSMHDLKEHAFMREIIVELLCKTPTLSVGSADLKQQFISRMLFEIKNKNIVPSRIKKPAFRTYEKYYSNKFRRIMGELKDLGVAEQLRGYITITEFFFEPVAP